jgi:hypothetical protein
MIYLLRRIVIAVLIPFLWKQWRERRRPPVAPAPPAA